MLKNRHTDKYVEAGCDEAGRGCLAGPVYAAAVILPDNFFHKLLDDSKKISEKNRYILREYILEKAIDWAVGIVDNYEIDKINILNASIEAMHRALNQLNKRPEFILVDGNKFKQYQNIEHKTIVKGDGIYASIAAASILAKTYRDDYMKKIHSEFPVYNWTKNKGYPTREHKQAVLDNKLTKYHRKTFCKFYFENKIKFTFLLFGVTVEAQYAEFRHISTGKGLASSEVYCQLQDSLGYMWFGTSRGLSRYDGYEFKNYTASAGLPSNSIIRMFYDRFGRIWFATYDGVLSYYENGEFHLFEHNDTLSILSKNYYILDIYVDKNKSIWVMPSLGGIYEFTTDGKVIDRLPKDNSKSFYFKDFGDGMIYSYMKKSKAIDSINLEVNDEEFFISGIKNGFRKNFLKIRTGEYLMSLGSDLYYIRNNHIIDHKKYQNDITGLFCDNNKNFWISVLYEGVYYYLNSDLNALPEIYLAGMSPIAVFQDHQNGFWLSTTENGVYYSPSFQFISYKRFGIPLFNILSIHITNKILYFSTFDRQVIKCNLNKHRIMSIENLQIRPGRDFAIQDIVSTKDSTVWFLGNELIKIKNNEYEIIAFW